MEIGNIFSLLFTDPITNLLVVFYTLLVSVSVPFALGFSIILLTIFIRLILYPFVTAQIKSAHKMQRAAPHIAQMREKHKDDKKRQQEEMMRIYKEHGVNPASGCLPLLIQIPVIWSLYRVLTGIVAADPGEAINKVNEIVYFDFLHINQVWDTHFFGLPLSQSPSEIFTTLPVVALSVSIITGAFQFLLSKMMMPEVAPKKKTNDMQSAIQTQSLYIFPVMIGFFSFTFPIGLSLYWNTFTLFGILQQYLLVGPGGLTPWITRFRNGK